jgi:uncharacterized LabA/DUF88 family protein
MIFYPEERLAIFIDGANLYSAARGLAFDIDYKRLLDLFSTKGRLIRAFYYTALLEDQEYSPIRPLVDWLDYNGYTMVTKPTKEFTDAMGRRSCDPILRGWRFPAACRGGSAQGSSRFRCVDYPFIAPNGFRRPASPG